MRKALNSSTLHIDENNAPLLEKGEVAGQLVRETRGEEKNGPKENVDIRDIFTFENIGKTIA